ncbi:MAG: protein kinase, partial [Myxococcales bacterium]|nr:protein kinase [Myxococcales bacterium]
ELRNAHEAVQRLRDEGRMLAILQHPCIVRVLEMTLIRGRVTLVTEYLDGLDLARACKPTTRLPLKVLLGIAAEVASVLHCAWTTPSPETGKPLQLIHRDIKPDNIRIGSQGEVKVLDFGIARTTEMYRHAKTAQGQLPFTPGYAPPEAFTRGFQGSPSDIFALGVTLYRLLVAERFYEGVDLSGQLAICCLEDRYTPFLEKRLALLDVPPGVRALVAGMLAYDPAMRPTADEVERRCRALEAEQDGPDRVQWARAMTFPPPKEAEGASLTGMTIQEDAFDGRRSRRHNPREEHRRKHGRGSLIGGPPADPLTGGSGPPRPSAAEAGLHPLPPPDAEIGTKDDPTVSAKTTLDSLMEAEPGTPGPPAVPEGLERRGMTPAPATSRPDDPTRVQSVPPARTRTPAPASRRKATKKKAEGSMLPMVLGVFVLIGVLVVLLLGVIAFGVGMMAFLS